MSDRTAGNQLLQEFCNKLEGISKLLIDNSSGLVEII